MTELLCDQPIRVTVRADAGHAIGYGHVQRTLSVISSLETMARVQVRYLMKPDSDPACVESSGHDIIHMQQSCIESIMAAAKPSEGPLILDTYETTKASIECLHQAGYCTIVFDDGNRLERYAANVVIDCAPGADELHYRGLDTTRFCLGPAYYPLRREFFSKRVPRGDGQMVSHVVVTFGGSDPDDQTARILRILSEHPHRWTVTAVAGPGYTGQAEEVAERTASICLKRNVVDMAEVLAAADLAISGAGGTALELAFLGVPALLLVLSRDQERMAAALAKAGAAVSLGRCEHIPDYALWQVIEQVAGDLPELKRMSAAGRQVIDGEGANRIAQTIISSWSQHCHI